MAYAVLLNSHKSFPAGRFLTCTLISPPKAQKPDNNNNDGIGLHNLPPPNKHPFSRHLARLYHPPERLCNGVSSSRMTGGRADDLHRRALVPSSLCEVD